MFKKAGPRAGHGLANRGVVQSSDAVDFSVGSGHRMTTAFVIVFLSSTLFVGLYLISLHLPDVRQPIAIGLHGALGLSALISLGLFVRGAANENVIAANRFGYLSCGFLALAALLGLMTSYLARRSPMVANVLLLTHASLAAAGFVLCAAWISSLN
jgi:hypothetical protein